MKKLLLIIAILVTMIPMFAQAIKPIANIQDSTSFYQGQTVTVQGVVTIGAGKLSTSQLKAYIQDDSGRGIMLFDYSLTAAYNQNIIRGNLLKVTARVTEYQGVTELTNFTSIEVLDQGAVLPVITMSITEAGNYQYYEGTYVKLSGSLTENPYVVGGGANITIKDELNKTITARVWDSTGINYTMLSAGIPIDAYGVVSPYNNKSQILPAYQQDIVIKLTEPVVSDIVFSPTTPYVDQAINVSAKVRDYNGTITYAKLFYRMGDETDFREILMTPGSNNLFSATIPAFNTLSNDEGEYIFYVFGVDNDSISVSSPQQRIEVNKRKPIISNVNFPNNPNPGEELTVQAQIIDSDGRVVAAKVLYATNYSQNYKEVVMDSVAVNYYEATIPGFSAGTIVNIKIWAQDDSLLTAIEDENNDGGPIRYTYPVTTHKAILKVTPKAYDVYNGDLVEIGYFGKSGDRAIIRIYNAEGKLIATPVNGAISQSTGISYTAWNGKDKNQQLVEPGMYICFLEVSEYASGDKKTAQVPIVIGTKLK